jgi:uncharacterized protein YjdB
MTFLHRLAHSLTRMRGLMPSTVLKYGFTLAVAAAAAGGCYTQSALPAAPALALALADSLVPVASVTVSPFTGSVRTGGTLQLTATARDTAGNVLTGRTFTWLTGNRGVATVDSTGLVTGVTAGGDTLAAMIGAVGGPAIVTVGIVPVASVTVSPFTGSFQVGGTLQLTATARDSAGNLVTGRRFTWLTSNTRVATVDSTGLATGVAAGGDTLAAMIDGVGGPAIVTVGVVPVASVTVSPLTGSLPAGGTLQLTATPKDAGGNPLSGRVVTWGSSNAAAATVNASGLVTGVAPGAATITATSEGQNATAAITVTSAPVASVTVTPATASLAAGQTVQLTADPKDANGNALSGRVVTWASSNTAAASVNGSGLVTAVAAGAATMTATSEGQSGTAAVTVTTIPVASVTVTPTTASVTVGQTVQLTANPVDASGNPLSGRVVTWGSSSTAAATVSGTGLVTGQGAGSATITATSEGKNGTAAVTVALVPVASVTVSPFTSSVQAAGTMQLTATARDAAGNVLTGRTVTWLTSNSGVATVNTNGLVTGVAAGGDTLAAMVGAIGGPALMTVTAASGGGGAWPNEPAGMTVVSDQNFSTLETAGWTSDYPPGPGMTATTDASAPFSPSGVAQFFYGQGDASLCGSSPGTLSLATPLKSTLYIGTWAKFSAGFSFPGGTPGSEVHFLYGNPQSNAWVTVDLRQDGGVEFIGAGGTDVYSASGLYTVGAWTRVELLMDYNAMTATLWLNGTAVSFGGVTVVHFGYSGGGFSKVQVSPTWGGCGGASPANDSWIWYDHIRVSEK